MPLCPKGYFHALGWCFWPGAEMPERSILPLDELGVKWVKGDVPDVGSAKRNVQGWKAHVAIHPNDIEHLADVIAPYLQHQRVAHKFYPFDEYKARGFGRTIWTEDSGGVGKACVIYPDSPEHLARIVTDLEARVQEARTDAGAGFLRPYPGGVKGDLPIGPSGLMFLRYGGFSGGLADKGRIYNPWTQSAEVDPRGDKPFPDFIGAIPRELLGLRRRSPSCAL